MNGTRTGIILSGLAIVVGASLLGYGLSKRVEQTSSPSPSGPQETSTPSPEASPSPSPSPSPTPEPVPSAAPTARPPETAPVLLTIESVPALVASGTPMVVHWQVRGPAGTRGIATHLAVHFEGSVRVQSSQASSFEIPARFEATVTPTGTGTLTLTAEVTVDGQTLRAEQSVRVE